MPLYAYLIVATVFIAAPLIANATPRADERLCEEVAEAVYESVTFGYLTKAQADEITEDCYALFS